MDFIQQIENQIITHTPDRLITFARRPENTHPGYDIFDTPETAWRKTTHLAKNFIEEKNILPGREMTVQFCNLYASYVIGKGRYGYPSVVDFINDVNKAVSNYSSNFKPDQNRLFVNQIEAQGHTPNKHLAQTDDEAKLESIKLLRKLIKKHEKFQKEVTES